MLLRFAKGLRLKSRLVPKGLLKDFCYLKRPLPNTGIYFKTFFYKRVKMKIMILRTIKIQITNYNNLTIATLT